MIASDAAQKSTGTIDVILVGGYSLEVSAAATKMYFDRAGVTDYFFYTWIDEADDGQGNKYALCDIPPGRWEHYIVTNKNIGNIAYEDDVEKHVHPASAFNNKRTDPILISVLKELGTNAQAYSPIYIATIPDNIEWHIAIDMDTISEYVQEGKVPPVYPQTWYGEPLRSDEEE